MDYDLSAMDDANARYLTSTMHITTIGFVGCECADFEKGGTRIEKQIEPFAYRELFVLLKAVKVSLRTFMAGCFEAFVQLLNTLRHGCVILAITFRARIQATVNAAHASFSSGRIRANTAPR
jgi:hypothetical protein